MGACHHIDTVTCDNCRVAIMARRWGVGIPMIEPTMNESLRRFIGEINRYQWKPRDNDQQDAAWRDLAGL